MIEFSIETVIARAPEDVFAYVADPAKLSTWQTNTVSVTQEGDGPLGLGTRLREVHNAPAAKNWSRWSRSPSSTHPRSSPYA